MKKVSETPENLEHHLYSLLIPEEILRDFVLSKIEEHEELLTFTLIESEDKVPLIDEGVNLVQNGFQNALEIQGFPIMGKQCILRLIRRRWKEQSTGKGEYRNTYSYVVPGTKVTPKFGDFLKEAGL